MREFALLQHIFESSSHLCAAGEVMIGPGDDMAMIGVGGARLLAAVDQIVDGRHVTLASTPLELVGRKAITRCLSDVAAMAAKPVASLVAATLPHQFRAEQANALFDAMRHAAEQYHCPIIGGDIAFHSDSTHPMVCSVTVLAQPASPDARVISRSGAQVGDLVCVTGPLGGSLEANGLGRHLTFEPRIDLAQRLLEHLCDRLHAMIDISDGLGRDASHIAALSNVRIEIDARRIPAASGCDWKRAVSDGEDYELCFTAAAPVPASIGGCRIYEVGHVVPRGLNDQPLVLIRDGADTFRGDDLGWQHEA